MVTDKKKKGGAREGAGRKKRDILPVETIDGRTQSGQQHAIWLIDELNRITGQWPTSDINSLKNATPEVRGWIPYWSGGDGLEARKYLYDKGRGKATITVNHLHDKPLEMNITHSISERMKIALEKADKRVAGSR